jgi:sigma-B regulation protein RsbU (phosphoserine phosphatase)
VTKPGAGKINPSFLDRRTKPRPAAFYLLAQSVRLLAQHKWPEKSGSIMTTEPGSLLIVEDEASYRDMLARYLERQGYQITVAQHGGEALELTKTHRFDLVLLDILLPGLSGFDILTTLRQQYSATDLPVITATARDESRDVVEALKLGANDYVTKPFDFPVVLARVQTQMSLKRSVDRITRLEQSLVQRNAELEAANAELAEANRRMRRDLEAAARVQQALLPAALPRLPGAVFAWQFRPCAELAGDLLNVAMLDDRRVGLYILDVVGHGVKAALLAVMANRALTQLLAPRDPQRQGPTPPAQVAAHLNSAFPWDDRTEQFFTLLYGILDLGSGEFRFISAGHPGPLHQTPSAGAWVLMTSGSPIGLGEGAFEETSLTLKEGDRLYLFSDGLLDAMDANGRRFGDERLQQAIEQGRAAPLAESLAYLLRRVEEWCGEAAPHDDISILAVEIAQPGIAKATPAMEGG